MDIDFDGDGLKRTCQSERASTAAWGPARAAVVRRRLEQLAAFDTLADLGTLLPAAVRALSGARGGQFAVDALPPGRIVFKPAGGDTARLADGTVDRSRVTSLTILDVETLAIEDDNGR